MAKGCSRKEIAGQLQLAEGTVKRHVTAVFRALEINNRTHEVIKAALLGLTAVSISRV